MIDELYLRLLLPAQSKSHRVGDRGHYQFGRGDRLQGDKTYAVGELVTTLACGLNGQARLAAAPRARQSQ